MIDLAPGGDSYQENCPPQTPLPTWKEIVSQNRSSESSRCVFRPLTHSAEPRSLTVLGDYLYFIANGDELFRTDGTARGLQKIGPVNDEYSFIRADMVKLGNRLLLTGYHESSGRSRMWVFQDCQDR